MEETVIQDKAGFMSRIAGIFTRTDEFEEDAEVTPEKLANGGLQLRANYRYTVTVRRQITSFDDAMAAANGLKARRAADSQSDRHRPPHSTEDRRLYVRRELRSRRHMGRDWRGCVPNRSCQCICRSGSTYSANECTSKLTRSIFNSSRVFQS